MPDVNALLVVQRLDTTADQLRHRRAHLPERAALRAVQGDLRAVRSELTALDERLAATSAEEASREAEVEVIAAKRASLAKKLAHTSVPREAEALTAELATLAHRQDGHEERLLELMEEVEPLGPRRHELVAREAELAAEEIVAQAEVAAAEVRVDAELADVQGRRSGALSPVPEALLQRYEKLRLHLGGVAVAELEGNHCSGCNLALASSEVERLHHLGPDVLAECENCGRILAR